MTQQQIFSVQGSSENPYQTSFHFDGTQLRAYCSCAAGVNGQFCKHRLAILNGSTTAIVSANKEEANIVMSWIKGTDLEQHIALVIQLEKQADEVKRNLAKAKKALSQVMARA